MDKFKKIREEGFRVTSQRKNILDVISSNPKTANQIFEKLRTKKIEIDLVSVYRTLMLFLKFELVSEVDFGDGKKRYELIKENNHHHHIICSNCGDVEDVVLNQEKKLLKEITDRTRFQIDKHSLEFFGICQTCQ